MCITSRGGLKLLVIDRPVAAPRPARAFHFEPERELVGGGFGQGDAPGELIGVLFAGIELVAHDDAEPALAVRDNPIHLLVLRCTEEGQVDMDGLATMLGLGADTIHPSGALFQGAGVPAEVVVDDMPAVQVEVNALGQHAAGHQDIGVKRCVEGEHEFLPGNLGSGTVDQSHIRHEGVYVFAL